MKLNPADTIKTIKDIIANQFEQPLHIRYISLLESDDRTPLDDESLLSTHIESANAWREEPKKGQPITLTVHLYRHSSEPRSGGVASRPATRFHF